jgi:hypothetical protein
LEWRRRDTQSQEHITEASMEPLEEIMEHSKLASKRSASSPVRSDRTSPEPSTKRSNTSTQSLLERELALMRKEQELRDENLRIREEMLAKEQERLRQEAEQAKKNAEDQIAMAQKIKGLFDTIDNLQRQTQPPPTQPMQPQYMQQQAQFQPPYPPMQAQHQQQVQYPPQYQPAQQQYAQQQQPPHTPQAQYMQQHQQPQYTPQPQYMQPNQGGQQFATPQQPPHQQLMQTPPPNRSFSQSDSSTQSSTRVPPHALNTNPTVILNAPLVNTANGPVLRMPLAEYQGQQNHHYQPHGGPTGEHDAHEQHGGPTDERGEQQQ